MSNHSARRGYGSPTSDMPPPSTMSEILPSGTIPSSTPRSNDACEDAAGSGSRVVTGF